MKKNQLQQQEKIQEPNKLLKYRSLIVLYIDIVIRGLISFFFIGILLEIILGIYLHLSFIIVLVAVFIVSIFVAPFLSKIKWGEKIWTHYENWLDGMFKLQN